MHQKQKPIKLISHMKTEENLNLDQNNKNTKNDNWKVGVSMAVGTVYAQSIKRGSSVCL